MVKLWNERTKREVYNGKKREVKRTEKESQWRADEDYGRQLSANWMENRKLFWKEVRKVCVGRRGGCKGIKDASGKVVKEKDCVVERWRKNFQQLLDVENDLAVVATHMGMDEGAKDRMETIEKIYKQRRGMQSNEEIGKACRWGCCAWRNA